MSSSGMLTPPTDSLYKFMAVFGLVITVTGFLLISQADRSFNEASIAITVEFAKIYQDYTGRLQALGEILKQYNDTNDPDRSKRSQIMRQIEESGWYKYVAEREKDPSYVKAQEVFDYAKDEYIKAVTRYASLSFAGIFLAAIGFYLWYVRVQRHLDKLLVERASRKDNVEGESSS